MSLEIDGKKEFHSHLSNIPNPVFKNDKQTDFADFLLSGTVLLWAGTQLPIFCLKFQNPAESCHRSGKKSDDHSVEPPDSSTSGFCL
jgi:hypothetical protein